MKPTPKKQTGFTLIEIVIVLAIAALIMVIVFLAIQGAQRSRRDTQRKNAASQVLAQAENYASNNSGTYPASDAFPAAYKLQGNANLDPLSNSAYTYNAATATFPSGGPASISYKLSGKIATVCIGLETGGPFCVNN